MSRNKSCIFRETRENIAKCPGNISTITKTIMKSIRVKTCSVTIRSKFDSLEVLDSDTLPTPSGLSSPTHRGSGRTDPQSPGAAAAAGLRVSAGRGCSAAAGDAAGAEPGGDEESGRAAGASEPQSEPEGGNHQGETLQLTRLTGLAASMFCCRTYS